MKKNLLYLLLPVIGIVVGAWVYRTWWGCKTVIPKKNSELTCKNSIQGNVYNGVDALLHPDDTSINTADIFIDTVIVDTVAKHVYGVVKCSNNANDAGWDVKAMVFLPAEVYIKTMTSTTPGVKACLFHGKLPNGGGNSSITAGYVVFSIDNLNKCDSFNFKVEYERTTEPAKLQQSKNGANFNFSVFAYNQVPDTKPENNYWYWKVNDNKTKCNQSKIKIK